MNNKFSIYTPNTNFKLCIMLDDWGYYTLVVTANRITNKFEGVIIGRIPIQRSRSI